MEDFGNPRPRNASPYPSHSFFTLQTSTPPPQITCTQAPCGCLVGDGLDGQIAELCWIPDVMQYYHYYFYLLLLLLLLLFALEGLHFCFCQVQSRVFESIRQDEIKTPSPCPSTGEPVVLKCFSMRWPMLPNLSHLVGV